MKQKQRRIRRSTRSLINNHVWVSEEYREYIQQTLNIRKPWQWRLLEYLLFYPHTDRHERDDEHWDDDDRHRIEADERVVISVDYIQALTGIYNRPVYQIMNEFFEDTGLSFDVCGYVSFTSTARAVTVHWPPELLAATDEELLLAWRNKSNIVLFSTGQLYSERKQAEFARQHLKNIMALTLNNPEHPAAALVAHLHSPRVNYALSKQVDKTEDMVYAEIENIEDVARRRYAMRTYNMVRQCAYIGYRDVEKTSRVYAVNNTILHLPREVRKKVFAGTWSLDLRSSQLAIVADLWGLKQVREFLDAGGSIWTELLNYLDFEPTYKPHVKTLLYSMIFGMGKKRLCKKATELLGNNKLMRHFLIKELMECRSKQLSQIVAHGGEFDVWGKFHRIGNFGRDSDKTQAAKKVLARVVQSYEVEIMLAGFEEIQRNSRNLCLLAWLHDGVYVTITDHENLSKKYLSRVDMAVRKRAYSLGIKAELEIEHL